MLEFSARDLVGLIPFRLSINAKTHLVDWWLTNCQSLVTANNNHFISNNQNITCHGFWNLEVEEWLGGLFGLEIFCLTGQWLTMEQKEEWQNWVELAKHIFVFACGLRASYFLHGGPEAADTLCDGLALLQSSTSLLVPSLLKSYILLIFCQLQERHKPCWSQVRVNWHGKNLKGQMDDIHFMPLWKTQSATLPLLEDPDQEGNAAHQSPCGLCQTWDAVQSGHL